MCDFFKTELAFDIFLPTRLLFGPKREAEACYEAEIYDRQLDEKERRMIKGLQRTELALPMCPVHGPLELVRGDHKPFGRGWTVAYSWWCGGDLDQRRRDLGICACPGWDEKLGARCRDCGLEI
jgi:hypothetical protein